ncbi:exonuclease domain-containing protein [Corynebacterium suranareeae]|uniref:exonuclease domain-containing protein n=1 Tax=Corynebacterium suranareeae TaxID=2506452 RepID=UPI00142E803E|nr:exonuclease domain-containing protein [Corynebacterium suranareeae]
MIAAHGASLTVDDSSLIITYSPLLAALSQSGTQMETVDISAVSGVSVQDPTAYTQGSLTLEGVGKSISFSPNSAKDLAALVDDINAILKGEKPKNIGANTSDSSDAPAATAVAGLDFVGFDVETANDDWGSICQIGLVKYKDGLEETSVSWLCSPPESLNFFNEINIGIHGITPEMVADQPRFADLVPQMVDFVGDLPLVAHNAQFDFTALSRACAASGIDVPEMIYGCSLTLARNEKLQVENHKLPTVASHLGFELKNHHDATEDARACAAIAIALARRHSFEGSFVDFVHSRGFTMGTVDNARVYPVLKDRSGANVALQRRNFGLDAGKKPEVEQPAVDHAWESPKAEPKKQSGRRAPWDKVATPDVIPDPNPDADPSSLLYGHNVTLTGDFEPYEKGALWQRIADQGATIGKNVTKKTTILVAGPWATITSKQKRAEELKEKGQDIQIWDEKQLFTALGLDEQPPF